MRSSLAARMATRVACYEYKGVGEFHGNYFIVVIRPMRNMITPSLRKFTDKDKAAEYAGYLLAKAERIFGREMFW